MSDKNAGQSPQTFYNVFLKPFLKNNIKQSTYRTYEIGSILNVKLVDYRF